MEYLSASSMDDKAFQSLALLCGLWTPPSQPTEIVMLPWSPLKACYNAGPVDPSPGDLLECAKRWIRDRFATTLARFDDCSMRLMNQGFPWRCQNFIIRGRRATSKLPFKANVFQALVRRITREIVTCSMREWKARFISQNCSYVSLLLTLEGQSKLMTYSVSLALLRFFQS